MPRSLTPPPPPPARADGFTRPGRTGLWGLIMLMVLETEGGLWYRSAPYPRYRETDAGMGFVNVST